MEPLTPDRPSQSTSEIPWTSFGSGPENLAPRPLQLPNRSPATGPVIRPSDMYIPFRDPPPTPGLSPIRPPRERGVIQHCLHRQNQSAPYSRGSGPAPCPVSLRDAGARWASSLQVVQPAVTSERTQGPRSPESMAAVVAKGDNLNSPDYLRMRAIGELLATERIYLADMRDLEKMMESAKRYLNQETVRQIFRNVGEIVVFHTSFLQSLEKATAPLHHQMSASCSEPRSLRIENFQVVIGPVFDSHLIRGSLIRIYERFLNGSHGATRLLALLQLGSWSLDSLLIKPLQRLIKYHDLIGAIHEQTARYTDPCHLDLPALDRAQRMLKETITRINETIPCVDKECAGTSPPLTAKAKVIRAFQPTWRRHSR
ncbi:Dbl homology domain-containing protein [Emericellopsis atlantica]|uniref:Dbl homology domain-containing protein n=1 Tax=Emericellopsis atlantica TaxID=2614577 RepID=A0A9P7ZC93_9HYPO|nr:Dbl homology domain-containing protein [Emericellopsis atlantica]KAG9249444.1 Dbl homology domain-containing protein [Emericellopsis atlantica]